MRNISLEKVTAEKISTNDFCANSVCLSVYQALLSVMTGTAEIDFLPVVSCTELFLHISFILIRCVAMFSAAMAA